MRGFTLIELVVVLAIIAIVTHLAVRELAHLADAKRTETADRQIEPVREAVFPCTVDGAADGFLSDMGRLPRPTAETNEYRELRLSLAELWRRPANAKAFALRPATAENLKVPDAQRTALTDADVLVPTGWRGPYLRLPLGRDELLDPWGNPFANPDSAGFNRLTVSNGVIVAVAHGGPSARDFAAHTRSLIPDGGATSRLVIGLESVGGALAAGTSVTYRWYGPADGLITGDVQTVTYPAQAVFDALTPGVRILKDSASGLARRLVIRPGDNLVQIRVP